MCGIFGQIGAPLDEGVPTRVGRILHHRGPDEGGLKVVGPATLIHRRLKVVDLSPAAAQPMTGEDGTAWVTFNGEIYNFRELRKELEAVGHRFKSRSDTEVIVHGYEQWGEGVVARLDGMFAFGLWDQRKQRLLCARDRMGKKPLFYSAQDGRFMFASEIKALFAAGLPIGVDFSTMGSLLAYGYVPPPETLYRQVEQLPPAHFLVLDEAGGRPRIERYWDLSFDAGAPAPAEEEAAEKVRELLTQSVSRRLVSDVPLGVFLSGGLDSTIIAGIMAKQRSAVKTFSIGFSGDARYDERSFARTAAQAFGTEHQEFVVEPRHFDLLEKLIWHHDGPFGDSSALPTFVISELTRRQVTVALNGDGGDEIFAGYLRFWAASLAEKVPAPLRRTAAALSAVLPDGMPERGFPARLRRFLRAAGQPLGDRITTWNSYFAFGLPGLLQPKVARMRSPEAVLEFHRRFYHQPGRSTPLSQSLRHNFFSYLPFDLLVKVDRMSMAHGLEARSPFLDIALVEYTAALPDRFKLNGRASKYILRRAFADIIPPSITARGKMGFGMPLGTWFRGHLKDYLRERICAADSRINKVVQPAAVSRIFDEHAEGRADHSHQLWLMLTIEMWLRRLPFLGSPF